MFVAIENNEMTVPQVLDWINRTKNANNNVISPEFAMEILGKTNFYGHIKVVLKNIKENCKTKEDIEPYKEFILSCVDRREMSEQAMVDLQEMAKLCGCEEEFDEANDKVKIYEVKDCENADVKIIKTKKELEALEGENLRVFYDADKVDLPWCNLDKVKKIRFKEGAEVDLWEASNLPKDLDVSMCSVVDLSGCDLEGLKLKFREGARVDLSCAENLPEDLDVSMCSKVNLGYCNIWVLDLKFREGAEAILHNAKHLPKDLDFSMCSYVDLNGCDLSRVEKITFSEGVEVDLHMATELPKELDLSMCSKVNLGGCYLNRVHRIKFKDKEQEKEFMDGALNFSCEVEYVGDDEKGKVMPMSNNGMEM